MDEDALSAAAAAAGIANAPHIVAEPRAIVTTVITTASRVNADEFAAAAGSASRTAVMFTWRRVAVLVGVVVAAASAPVVGRGAIEPISSFGVMKISTAIVNNLMVTVVVLHLAIVVAMMSTAITVIAAPIIGIAGTTIP